MTLVGRGGGQGADRAESVNRATPRMSPFGGAFRDERLVVVVVNLVR